MEHLKVQEEKVKVLTVTVVKATGVSVGGYFGDWETPDPYVMLRVRSSPNAKQRTTTKGDEVNPVWNETFTFYLNPEKKNTLELIMMDDDFGFDDTVGKKEIELDGLLLNEKLTAKIGFNEKTTLEISLLVTNDERKELRFSYDICDEEKEFLKKRTEAVLKNMSKLGFGEKTPRNEKEVPVIAIMGSGGGYRAACGLSGVMVALQESGILDCATYMTGLSGSSWYITSLYIHKGWPHSMSCQEMADDLKKRFNTKLYSHFHLDYKRRMDEKAKSGQPVRFTDFFGMAIGDALLPTQDCRLSNIIDERKMKACELPLPITTGIRVRADIPAGQFSEWIEFTPHEYGSAKYGVFGKIGDFGGKYYKGQLVKKYPESPLYYLQGIWGSAFSIILDSLTSKSSTEKSEEERHQDIAQAMLKDAGNCKTEDHDSEDEETPEDEIDTGNWVAEMLNPGNILSSRKGKAAECFNFCRGLKFCCKDDVDHGTGKDKTICVVDSGIAFNSPFPTVLRPERKVELILSFDFSQRDSDEALPFGELLKAEQWARDHGHAFPKIKGNPIIDDPDIRECYVFHDKDDDTCPIILHFPIVNKTFRKYVAPGVPRKTRTEKDFANFDIFDDPETPYSSFQFEYAPETFQRLHELMKFNTLLNMDLIKEKIAYYVGYRRNNRQYAERVSH